MNQRPDIISKAKELAARGITVIPLDGKKPIPLGWQKLRQTTPEMIAQFEAQGAWRNIGMVCGEASRNIIVIDCDGLPVYEAFCAALPHLSSTYTVKTGSGNGMHLYYTVDALPPSNKLMDILIGDELCNFEIKSNGTQVVIPPSIHPDTGDPYTKYDETPIRRLNDLSEIWNWALSLKPNDEKLAPLPRAIVNARLLDVLTQHFLAQDHVMRDHWIDCACPNSAAHRNGDTAPSFGFDTQTGAGNCFRCGGMSTKQIAEYIGLDTRQYGGILAPAQAQPPAPLPPVTIPVIMRQSRFYEYNERAHATEMPLGNAPIPFPFSVLHPYGGCCLFSRPNKLTGIVGISGGGKTTLLETLTDGYLAMGTPVLVWGNEFDPDEYVQRAIQRHGGPTVDQFAYHELWLSEQAAGKSSSLGRPLTDEQRLAAAQAQRLMRGWQADVGYLDEPFLTVEKLQQALPETLSTMALRPRILIVDYVQLLHANEDDSAKLYPLLMRLKTIGRANGLHVIVASQSTKDSVRGQRRGDYLDSQAARWVNDDAFNLFVTVNPDYAPDSADFTNHAVLNIAKNTGGQKGKVRVYVNWERQFFSDQLHPNQNFGENG